MKNNEYINFKLILLLAAVVLIQACSGDEVIDDNSRNEKIGFSLTTEKSKKSIQSRVGELTIDDVTDFKVSAQLKAIDTDPFASNFMYGINVVKTAPDTWVYSPIKYKPKTGGVDFYAYSPANSLSATNFLETAATPSVEYIVSPAANLQEDFLIANSLAAYVAPDWTNPWEATGKVPLNFKHALSQIVFQGRCELEGLRFIVKSITLTNLKPKGDINLATQVWSNISGDETDYPADVPNPILFEYDPAQMSGDTYTVITDHQAGTETAMMVLPQDVTAGTSGVKTTENGKSHIAVTFAVLDWEDFPLYGEFETDSSGNIEIDSNGVPVVTKYATTYIPLQIGTIPSSNKFEQGKRYTFQLRFNSLIPIVFGVDVTAWDTTPGIIDID